MSYKRTFSGLLIASVAMVAWMAQPGSAAAEPPPCYSNAPDVLPAPMSYGRAYRTAESRVTYVDGQSGVGLRRTYSQPVVETTRRVVTTTPAVRYEEPVAYTRTYYEPVPVAYTYATPVYYPSRSYGYYGGQYGHRSYGYLGGHHSRRYYGSGHHSGHRRHSGFSFGYSRGHHGGHSRHFGFSFGRSSGHHGRSHGGHHGR